MVSIVLPRDIPRCSVAVNLSIEMTLDVCVLLRNVSKDNDHWGHRNNTILTFIETIIICLLEQTKTLIILEIKLLSNYCIKQIMCILICMYFISLDTPIKIASLTYDCDLILSMQYKQLYEVAKHINVCKTVLINDEDNYPSFL